MTISEFQQKQSLPYEAKVAHAEIKAWEFYKTITGRGDNVHVSVGGLDSITLLVFLRSIGINVPAVSVSILEDKGNYMKEKPCDDWAKEHNSYPYLGLMASEGGQREMGLMKNGCNYYGKKTTRSCPFAIFSRQDLLRLAVDLKVPIPRAYGEIRQNEKGELYTTRAQRTGCSMCGFGIHIEKRPHRFDRLREDNPKEWRYWMYECCIDSQGRKYGWGRVLDYIGVQWEDIPYDASSQLMFDI